MFMMTTDVNASRNQQIRDRHLNFNSKRTVDCNHPTDFVNPHFISSDDNVTLRQDYEQHTKPMIENRGKFTLPTGKPFVINHQDEGYSTDSKSNTSPSTTSPLSSSFSSLSTFDGSFNSPTSPSGGLSPNSNNSNYFAMHGKTQRTPAPQKAPLIQGNGKIHVNRHALVMAKKKDSSQDIQDNSSVNLEDRLRALTTIEEEEPGLSNSSMRETHKKEVYEPPLTGNYNSHINHPLPINGGRRDENGNQNGPHGQDSNAGFFRAVPVEISAPSHTHDQVDRTGNRNDNQANYVIPNTDTSQIAAPSGYISNDNNWYDYRRYFEKDCDIPLHNIDALNRGKFTNAPSDGPSEKDINRQIRANPPQTPEAQVSSHNRQPGDGRDAPVESNQSFGNGGIRDLPNHNRTFAQGQVYGYPQNGQQNTSSSVPDLSLPYHSQAPNSISSNNYPHYHDMHPPQTRQQPHQQNQHVQHHPFYSEQSQQHVNAHLSNSQNRSSDSYNSLPRQYEDQRQHHTIFYSENQRDMNQFPENDVVLRRASSSIRALPDRVDRYSWQPDSRSKQPASLGSERYSLDLGNIPQLQQQIRATSEMCLQASKRHVFASSADIYKLFQGQKKPSAPPTSSSTNLKDFTRAQNRHSFHATPGASWARSQQNLQQSSTNLSRDPSEAPPTTSSKYHGLFPNPPSHPSPSPGPLRGDHSIPLPQTSWGGNSTHQPNSISSSSTYPLTLSELPQFQRQSSGYSSENELQQIEQNAKAVKKAKTRNGQHSQQGGINSDLEFVPVDPTLDRDSSSSIIDNEPVYVNQPMFANARARGSLTKSSPSQQSQLSTPPPPPIPARPSRLEPSSVVVGSNGGNSQPRIDVQGYNAIPNTQTSNPNIENRYPKKESNPSPSPVVITQKQVINFSQKPVTINSYIPNHPYNPNTPNTNGPIVDDRQNIPSRQHPSLQQLDFQSNLEQTKAGLEYLNPPKRSNSSRSNRTNSNPCTPLSPLEIAQVLDTPFATNVISDECGDRLSTLV